MSSVQPAVLSVVFQTGDYNGAITTAWELLPKDIQRDVVKAWGEDRKREIFIAASESMSSLVSSSISIPRIARDRLKATIASVAEADAAAGLDIYKKILKSMQEDIAADGQAYKSKEHR